MEDVELARSLLEQENLNLVVVREGQTITTSRKGGVRPLFEAVVTMGESLHGAAIADKIVGSAVAMLCLHAQISSVYAGIASKGALAMLEEQGINIRGETVVSRILNRDGSDLCPFEKLARKASSPAQLFSALESFFAEDNR